MVRFKDFSSPLSVFQVLFKAKLIFKDFSRKSCIFKYFSNLCEPCDTSNWKGLPVYSNQWTVPTGRGDFIFQTFIIGWMQKCVVYSFISFADPESFFRGGPNLINFF